MEQFLSQLGTAAIDNALSMGMLLAAVWWFAKRDSAKEEKIEALNKEKTQIYQDVIDKVNTVISTNSMTNQALKQSIDSLKEAVKK